MPFIKKALFNLGMAGLAVRDGWQKAVTAVKQSRHPLIVPAVGVLRKAKRFWQGNISNSTKYTIGILSVPGAVVKVAAVVGAGASILHVVGPYLLGWMAFTTTTIVGLVVKDAITSKIRRTWTNAAGQVVESSLLEKSELKHAERRLNRIFNRAAAHGGAEKKEKRLSAIVTHFAKYADRVTIKEDIPGGGNAFRYRVAGRLI